GRVTDIRPVDSALNLLWHAEQLHRLAAGLDPDPGRPWWRTLGSVVRIGPSALRPKRTPAPPGVALRRGRRHT
ncbi:hypothetical protein, partial [Spirillospora sp. NPDC029432]|uniref:hypothetical protein n=1 Tax=Spirillospora sp. NPDC029432 TaxID=3154599 RepID=UPI003451CDE8